MTVRFQTVDAKIAACDKIIEMDEWVWNHDDAVEIGNTWLMEGPPDGMCQEYRKLGAFMKQTSEMYDEIDDWYDEWKETFERVKEYWEEEIA